MRISVFSVLLVITMALCSGCAYVTAPSFTTEEPFYALDFTLTALDGASYTLYDLRGQWVIVTFWATTCPPCVEDMPLLQQLADDAEERLMVLGVNMHESEAAISPFLAPLKIRFPILLNPYDQMLLEYKVIGLPQTMLITPTGDILDRRFGPIDVEAWHSIIQK